MTSTSSPTSSFTEPPPSTPSPFTKVCRNAIASTLGASIVSTVVTPLDVVKVRLQAHVCPVGGSSPCEDPKHVEGSLDAVRKIIRHEGIRGLWRGLPVTLLLAIPTTGLYFTMYESLRERISDKYPGISKSGSAISAGALARAFTAAISSPLELARTSLQSGFGGPSASVGSVLKQVVRTQGPLALWRGLGPTLLRDAPFSAIYWSVYEGLKDPQTSILPQHLFSQSSEFAVFLGAGIGAGGLAALCTVPADVVKTRRQAFVVPSVNVMNRNSVAPGTGVIMRRIVEKEGIRGLFKGAGPRVAKVAPACAIMMGSYEWIRKLLGA